MQSEIFATSRVCGPTKTSGTDQLDTRVPSYRRDTTVGVEGGVASNVGNLAGCHGRTYFHAHQRHLENINHANQRLLE